MGRISENTRAKRKKRRDLQKIRQEALAAKRNLKKKKSPLKGKAALANVLKSFAEKRDEIAKKTQGVGDDKNGPVILSNKLLPDVGFFKKGYKSDVVKNNEKVVLGKMRQARLEGNFLQLMNGNKEKSKKFSNQLNAIFDNKSQDLSNTSFSSTVVKTEQCKNNDTTPEFKELMEYKNKSETKKKSIFDPTNNQKESELFYTDEPLRFPLACRSKKYLEVKKNVEVDNLTSGKRESSVNCRKITLLDIQFIKECSTKLGEKLFVDLNIDSLPDPLAQSMEYLKTTAIKNWSRNLKMQQPGSEFEMQACTGTTTQSIVCNALFPELQDSQLKYTNKTQNVQGKNCVKSISTSSSTVSAMLTPVKVTPIQRPNKNLLFPSSIFSQPEESKSYYNHDNFGITPQDRIFIDMNFSTNSLKAMSLDSDDEDAGREQQTARYLRDCKLRSRNNLANAYQENEVLQVQPRQRPKNLMKPNLVKKCQFTPPMNMETYLDDSDYHLATRNVHFMGNMSKVTTFNDMNSERQEIKYMKRNARQSHQPVSKKMHDFAQSSKHCNKDSHVPQCNSHRCLNKRSSDERSSSRSDERNFTSKSRMSSGDEVMVTNRKPRHQSQNYRLKNHTEQYMNCSRSSSSENSRKYEVNYKNNQNEPMQFSQHHSNFLNNVLNPPGVKDANKPTIVVVVPPVPVVHMHCDNVKSATNNAYRILNQATCQRPITFTITKDFEKNQRSAVINEFSDTSATHLSQPVKFMAVEDDEQCQKKPIYLSQDDNRSRRKIGRENSLDSRRLSKTFCFSSLSNLEEDLPSSRSFEQRESNHEHRSQKNAKNKLHQKLECHCSQDCSREDERECRVSKRKHCSLHEQPRCHRHDF